jgi:RHS repeat-associated protein
MRRRSFTILLLPALLFVSACKSTERSEPHLARAGQPLIYDGDPMHGGRLLGTVLTTVALGLGQFQDVSLALPAASATALPLWVVADDQGNGQGIVPESDETNNAYNSRLYFAPGANQPPAIDLGPPRSLTLPERTLALSATVTDDGLPAGILEVFWSQASGFGTVAFDNPESAETTATFPAAPGVYVLRLSATDGDHIVSALLSVTLKPENRPPIVDAGPDQYLPRNTTTLVGTATDDGLPEGSRLQIAWSQVSGPGAVAFDSPTAATTRVTFSTSGTYVLRLTATDGALTASDDVTVTVAINQAPIVSAGPDQTLTLPTSSTTLTGTATDDGLPAGSTLSTQWVQVYGPGTVVFSSATSPVTTAFFDSPGVYVLRLTASDGELQSTDPVTVTVVGAPPQGEAPSVAIASPADGADLTTFADVVGTVQSETLFGWKLEYHFAGERDFITLATGTSPVDNAILGRFDPTLLLNGLYELRLTATDNAARSASTSIHVVVKDNLKIGHFTLSWVDLEIPLSGLPIRLTRTYDSRDKRVGDFGIGWRLDVSNVRIQTNGPLGEGWLQTKTSQVFSNYCLEAERPHLVTVTFPDGRVEKFEAVPEPQCQGLAPIVDAVMTFRPLGATLGSLAASSGEDIVVSGTLGPVRLLDFSADDLPPLNPTAYEYTAPDGRVLQITPAQGLRRIIDLNGNTLRFTREGIIHSSGRSVPFIRDTLGRITRIIDPDGHALVYAYSAAGDLEPFTDREGNTTRFGYQSDHLLLTIQDPRGITPIRNEYDADGRLLRHTDSFGKTIEYQHLLNARQEIVTDRFGRARVLEYDERGNVIAETDPDGRMTTRTFDARNNRTSETNPLGHTWSYAYDDRDNLIRETDPLGNATVRTYNERRQVLTIRDPLGRVTRSTYDPKGNLTATADAAGNVTSYVYDSRGNLLSETAQLGCVTSYAYDTFGNRTRETNALGNVTSLAYDANGRKASQTTTRTTPAGTETLTTSYVYDRNGRLTQTTDPDGSITRTVYNELGKEAQRIDKLGRVTSYSYDDLGRLSRTTYADTTFEESTYDFEGRRLTSRDRGGRVTSYEYDALGRLVKTTHPDGAFTTSTFDAASRLVTTTDARGYSITYEYDAAGRQTRVADPLGNATRYGYDAAGNRTSVTDPRGYSTRYEHDALNREVRTILPDSYDRRTTYDALGRRIAETDQAGRTTRFTYDCLGRLAAVTDALSQVTSYGYDELGNRVSQTDANGHTTRFEYDRLGRETARLLPDGARETKAYDVAGNQVARTDFMGRTTTYDYDTNNRLLSRTYPDSSVVAFTYTATGRRASATDARGTTGYTYDLRDRLVRLDQPGVGALEYAYDGNGNRTELTAVLPAAGGLPLEDGGIGDGGLLGLETRLTTLYAYDDAGRLQVVTDPNSRIYTYGYDANGNRTSLDYPNSVRTEYSHDANNRLLTLTTTHVPTSNVIQGYTYTLGPTGNRTQIQEADGTLRGYQYDALYRLTQDKVTVAGALLYQKDFAYDPVGNRLAQTTTGQGAAIIGYTYDSRDRLLSENAASYGWDANGNLTTKAGEATYAWDHENRLIRVELANGTVVEHQYDADGNRVFTRTTPPGGSPTTTKFLVDTAGGLSHVVAEVDEAGALGTTYVRADDELAALLRTTGARFYHADGLGSVRRLTDEAGLDPDAYAFTAFGERLEHTGSDPQPFGFAGEPYDGTAGLAYHRARWLNPRLGAFVSSDPLDGRGDTPLSLHRYVYAQASPAFKVDPTGRYTLAEVAVVGAIVGVLHATAVSHYRGLNILQPAYWELLFESAATGSALAILAEWAAARVAVAATTALPLAPTAIRWLEQNRDKAFKVVRHGWDRMIQLPLPNIPTNAIANYRELLPHLQRITSYPPTLVRPLSLGTELLIWEVQYLGHRVTVQIFSCPGFRAISDAWLD